MYVTSMLTTHSVDRPIGQVRTDVELNPVGKRFKFLDQNLVVLLNDFSEAFQISSV